MNERFLTDPKDFSSIHDTQQSSRLPWHRTILIILGIIVFGIIAGLLIALIAGSPQQPAASRTNPTTTTSELPQQPAASRTNPTTTLSETNNQITTTANIEATPQSDAGIDLPEAATLIAPTTPGESPTFTQTPWQSDCANPDNRQCRSVSAVLNEDKTPIVLVSVGYSHTQKIGEDALTIFLTVPNGVDITEGISLTIDDIPLKKGAFVTCDKQKCIAIVLADKATLNRFKKGRMLNTQFRFFQGSFLVVPMSLIGFTKAFTNS